MHSSDEDELIKQYTKVQNELVPRIKLENNFQIEELQLIAGVDIAYWDVDNKTNAVCCIVTVDYHSKKIVEKVYSEGEITVPYIPGFLAFRELPLVIDTAKKLRDNPDLYLFDGNGYLHHRHMGIATHAAMLLNKPSIGVAKSYLKVGDADFIEPKNIKGAYTDIKIGHEVYGRAVRSRKDVKPIFVSCGNWISLDTATEIVMELVQKDSRLPIPTRYADIFSRRMRKVLRSGPKGQVPWSNCLL